MKWRFAIAPSPCAASLSSVPPVPDAPARCGRQDARRALLPASLLRRSRRRRAAQLLHEAGEHHGLEMAADHHARPVSRCFSTCGGSIESVSRRRYDHGHDGTGTDRPHDLRWASSRRSQQSGACCPDASCGCPLPRPRRRPRILSRTNEERPSGLIPPSHKLLPQVRSCPQWAVMSGKMVQSSAVAQVATFVVGVEWNRDRG